MIYTGDWRRWLDQAKPGDTNCFTPFVFVLLYFQRKVTTVDCNVLISSYDFKYDAVFVFYVHLFSLHTHNVVIILCRNLTERFFQFPVHDVKRWGCRDAQHDSRQVAEGMKVTATKFLETWARKIDFSMFYFGLRCFILSLPGLQGTWPPPQSTTCSPSPDLHLSLPCTPQPILCIIAWCLQQTKNPMHSLMLIQNWLSHHSFTFTWGV